MAFNKAPTTLLPSYSSDGTNMTIPIAAIPGLTSAEAHTTTGDWRAILFRLLSHAENYHYGLAAGDKSNIVSFGKSAAFNQVSRVNSVQLNLRLTTTSPDGNVSSES
jgi:hypothetical protein